MKRILITRPEPGATQTAERLKALGLLPVVAPVLSIVPRPIGSLGNFAATLLTSRNAISSCPPTLHQRPAFAVGTATGNQAAEAGFAHVFSADGDGIALANLVANTLSPKDGTLFLPTSAGQGSELTATLRRRGFRVIRRIAYRTIGISVLPEVAAASLREGRLAAAMFFSSETARHFVHLLQAAHLEAAVRNVEAVSISERAAVALRFLPWRRVSVAAKPNQDAMLVLLQ